MPIQSYDVQSPVYKRYIAEEPPHIVFSDEVKDLANRIPGNRENPLQAISNIFCWMNDHLMWIGAVEYGIQDSISTSVAQSLKGDCGMQTMLLMAVARCKGIPVRWQSGWMLHPGEVNLHDWCEVYYQGVGWVPLDVTFGMLRGDYSRAFYVTGMDSYRLAVNQGIGGVFSPPKRYRRSEPFDFQRGEVEWRGGNLYFDQWQYHLDVKMVD